MPLFVKPVNLFYSRKTMTLRNKFAVLTLLTLILTSGSVVLLFRHTQNHSAKIPEAHLQHQPDLIILNSTTSSYDQKGLLKSELTAEKTVHFDFQNSTIMTQPRMVIYTENRSLWNIRADRGYMIDGSQVIYLKGHVVLQTPHTATSTKTTITTSKLTYYPERSFAKTNQNVTILRPGAALSATGMTADLKKGILITQSKTRASYDPTTQ